MADNKQTSSSPFSTAALIAGLLIGLFGLFTLSGPVRSFLWELKLLCLYKEGECRVVSARISPAGEFGAYYELYVTHQVQIAGKTYPPNENAEEFPPSANTPEELTPLLAIYAPGSIHPCWY